MREKIGFGVRFFVDYAGFDFLGRKESLRMQTDQPKSC